VPRVHDWAKLATRPNLHVHACIDPARGSHAPDRGSALTGGLQHRLAGGFVGQFGTPAPIVTASESEAVMLGGEVAETL